MTQEKGRERVGEGKKNISKQDFIKILVEHQLVQISIALPEWEFSIYLVLFFFLWAAHGLFPKCEDFGHHN